jgi:CRISPR/Cas system CMR subunit Cmr6 (Cas7 group RAMP superfamily)
MSRALPADLIPVVDSRGPSVANPGLRVLRWIDWGDDFRFQEADETMYLKHMLNLFKKQAKPDSVLSRVLIGLHARNAERIEALRASGHDMRSLKTSCAGKLRIVDRDPACSDPGLFIHRTLGTPYVPSRNVLRLIDAGAALCAQQGKPVASRDGLMVFDAFPTLVPRLESELLPSATTVLTREEAAQRRLGRVPAELLGVLPGSEFEFWVGSKDPEQVQAGLQALEAALQAYSTAHRATQDDEPEVEIAAGPVMIPAPDGSTAVMVARASTVHYQVHNGRIAAMFRHSAGKDVKAEEHASNIMMTEEVRKRLAKKKVLQDVEIEVEAVGNAWRIRGIHG